MRKLGAVTEETVTGDLATIRDALTAFKRISYAHRYGGWGGNLTKAEAAIDALERVETEFEPRQVALDGLSDWEPKRTEGVKRSES